jgi:hypothetical protein
LDLRQLSDLARFYDIHPALLLLPPARDQTLRALDLARRMDRETAEDWLRLGERLASKPTA